MALHRTPVPRWTAAAAATLILLSGCDTLSFRRLDFDNTEAVKITRISVRPGAGDVVVRAAGTAAQVRIKRTVRYQGDEPTARYEIKGDELVLDTDCGPRCSLSYEVTAPAGVAVRGEAASGDVELSGVGPVELKLNSGNLTVTGATGDVRAETDSGNIEVADVAGTASLRAASGDVTGRRLAGTVDAEASSGNVTVELAAPASVRAHAASGNVDLTVPAGRYRVRAHAGSGDTDLGVPDDPTATLVLDASAASGNVTLTQR
ncbi:DUF4097 domain-containing protein [Micromonospora mangrovi]|uniref:DUF4097 family beta strand repeat-containing protein n=2 Tax=Micromonospora TaxID=1873 RepID=A0AAU8HDE1_9ACTN